MTSIRERYRLVSVKIEDHFKDKVTGIVDVNKVCYESISPMHKSIQLYYSLLFNVSYSTVSYHIFFYCHLMYVMY